MFNALHSGELFLFPNPVWMYAEQFRVTRCHLMLRASRRAVRDLRLHNLNVCQAISRKAVLVDVTLFTLTEYYAISSEANSLYLTL